MPIKNCSPQTRTSHLLLKFNLKGRDNENFSYSHQVNWSLKPPNENFSSSHHVYQKWQPPKRELLIFSSSQILKGEIMRTSHILIKLLEAPQTRTSHLFIMSMKLQASINLMRRWEVLIISPFKIRLDENMRSSHYLSLQDFTWWEDEKFSFGGAVIFDRHDEKMRRSRLGASIDLMRLWEVLITSPFKIWLDEKMRSSRLGGCHFW